MFFDLGLAVFLDHRLFDAALDFLGFAAQNRRLICYADGLQMEVGIKSGGIRAFEFFEKFIFVPTIQNVIADVISFRKRENDEIMSAAVGARLRSSGLGFLVLG